MKKHFLDEATIIEDSFRLGSPSSPDAEYSAFAKAMIGLQASKANIALG